MVAGAPTAFAAKAATSTIPIIFDQGVDPVQSGLVASLNRLGGNVTGVTILTAELVSKRLDLLHELLPAASSIALLTNPTNPVAAQETACVATSMLSNSARASLRTAGPPKGENEVFETAPFNSPRRGPLRERPRVNSRN